MADSNFTPTAVLGGYLRETDPDGAVKLARELCSQLEGDPDSFHGGVWPGNVDLDVDGKAVLGGPNHAPAARRPADQVEYTAPEFFWNGETSAAADVYAVGLMLYAGCNGGYLPFQPRTGELTDKDRANALRRRMKGEAVPAPKGVSDELKKVIEKALAYDPEARYITARELLTALGRTDEALPGAAAAGAAGSAGAAAVTAAATAETPAAEAPVPETEPDTPAAEAPVDLPEEDIPQPDETPQAEADSPLPADDGDTADAPTDEPQPEAAAEAEPAPQPEAEKERENDDAAAAALAGAAVAGTAAAAGTSAPGARAARSPQRQYKVQKDFDSAPRAQRRHTAAPASHRRRKKSRVVPVLCCLAAAAILGSVGYMVMGTLNGRPVESALFAPVTPAGETAEQTSPATAEPSAAPSAEPSATPRPSPRPTADPAATPSSAPGGQTISGPDGTELGTGDNGATTAPGGGSGGAGTGASGTGTSTGTGTGAGTGTGTGGGYTTGGGTGTGGSGGTTGGGTGSGGSGNTGTSSGSPGYTVEPASGTVYLTGDLVRVRSGPSTAYRILGVTHKGDSLTRTGTVSSGWTQVNYGSGSGFVYSSYLTTTDPSAPPTTPEPSATPTPSASPSPAPAYTVTAADKSYGELQGVTLAAVSSAEELTAVAAELDKNAALAYAWVGVEKADGTWKSGGADVPTELWKSGEPQEGNDWALLEKQADGTWKLISVKSTEFTDGVPETYQGKLGYVTQAATTP